MSEKENALNVWRQTGEIISMTIMEELRGIIGDKVVSDFKKDLESQYLADYEELWIFTNSDQVQRCDAYFFDKYERQRCLNKLLLGEIPWFILGWPSEH